MSHSLITNFCCFCFLIGILIGTFSNPFHFLFPALIICGFGLLIWRRYGLLFILVSFLCGSFYVHMWRNKNHVDFSPEERIISGVITDPADIRREKIFLTIQPDDSRGKIIISAPRYPVWNYGDYIQLKGKIEKPEAFNGFNYPLYLERFRIYGKVADPKSIRLIAHNRGSPFLDFLYRFRSFLEMTIQKTLPEPESSFLGGILLGSKRAIPDSIGEALRETGTSHIIAISGANITILLTIILSLLPIYSAKKKFWLVVLIGTFITLLTGASASVLRGALVAAFGCYLKMKYRRAWATPFILSSMILMLLGNPLLLVADPGFQLSFAAFTGLAYLGAPLSTFLKNSRLTKNLPDIIQGSISETTAATLGTLPLSIWMFHQISLLGLIVNPLILWILPAITLLGLGLLLLGWIGPVLTLLRVPLWLLLHAVLAIITSFAKLHMGTIKFPTPNG